MTAGYLRQQVLELVRSEPSVPSETVMKIDQELQFVEKPFDFLTIFKASCVDAETVSIGYRHEIMMKYGIYYTGTSPLSTGTTINGIRKGRVPPEESNEHHRHSRRRRFGWK